MGVSDRESKGLNETNPAKPFSFKDEDRDEILQIIGDNAELISDFENSISTYVRLLDFYDDHLDPPTEVVRRDFRRLKKAVDRFRAVLDEVYGKYEETSYGQIIIPELEKETGTEHNWRAFEIQLKRIDHVAEQLSQVRPSKQGRRTDIPRLILDHAIAFALRKHGIKISKYRDNPAVEVYRVIYRVVFRETLSDPFPLLKRIVDDNKWYVDLRSRFDGPMPNDESK